MFILCDELFMPLKELLLVDRLRGGSATEERCTLWLE